jgi:hypothetical protein
MTRVPGADDRDRRHPALPDQAGAAAFLSRPGVVRTATFMTFHALIAAIAVTRAASAAGS